MCTNLTMALDVSSEHVDQRAVEPFDLIVTLGVIRSLERVLHLEVLSNTLEEERHELWPVL